MTALVKTVSVENLMAHRATIEEKLQEAYDALHEAEEALDAIKENVVSGHVPIHIKNLFDLYSSSHRVDFMDGGNEGVKKALSQVDKNLWAALFDESGMRTFMDAQSRKEWDENLDSGEFPPLTPANIKATFAGLYEQRADFFERGVINVFRKLSWKYKSNSPVCFGRRIIVEYIFTNYSGWLSLNHDSCNKLDDLVRVFSVLDGKPEPDHRNGMYHTLAQAKAEKAPGELDLDYFRIKWFKNGNVHLYFNRPDLVDELNRIIKKHHPDALPPAKKDAWNPKAEAEARKHAHKNAKADFFPTPTEVADQLLGDLQFKPKDRILEPSAGGGALATAIFERGGQHLLQIEKDKERFGGLKAPTSLAKIARFQRADFLETSPTGDFDYVVMNPPFSGGQDIDHVMHAWEYLKPGGTLLAIVGAGAVELTGRERPERFQKFLKDTGAEATELPAGAFKEAGTMVRSFTVRIRKPSALPVAS